MSAVKTPQEIEDMREGGKKLGDILIELLEFAKPGVTLLDIEHLANDRIQKSGGSPSFTTVKDYKWATCLCINDVVVHGVPSPYVIKEGDVLTVDIGLLYKGFHTDTAWTKIVISDKREAVSEEEKKKEKFLKAGEEALWKAIGEAKVGNRIGHISQAIQTTIEGAGYSIVRTLVGHGVGRELHEAPQVPGMVRGPIEETLALQEGMTIAIEVIYAEGEGAVVYDNPDGWSIGTKDHSLSAVFEHTIAVTASEPLVLTRGSE